MTEIEERTADTIWFRQVLINHLSRVLPPFSLLLLQFMHSLNNRFFKEKPDKRFSLKNKIIYELAEIKKS